MSLQEFLKLHDGFFADRLVFLFLRALLLLFLIVLDDDRLFLEDLLVLFSMLNIIGEILV